MNKWRISVLRERYVCDYFYAFFTVHGYMLHYVGLGVGDARFIEYYFRGVDEALDFMIKTFSGKVVGFLDVTGYMDPEHAKIDSKRCVGSWKLEKARRIRDELEIPLRNIWFAHFTDSDHILVFINAERLIQLINNGRAEKRWLYEDEGPSYCLGYRYWIKPKKFVKLLQQTTR